MKELPLICVQTYLLILLLTYSQAAESSNEPKRSRGATTGLFPFPRVGRADLPQLPWGINSNPGIYLDKKREGLVAFPRIGKRMWREWLIPQSYMEPHMIKRSEPTVNTGMWFGPRLGRIQKRNAPYVVLTFADDQTDTRQLDYTPRMGRESEEDLEYP